MSSINWEERAKNRRIENKRLAKKCKELTTSRDGWKTKALDRKKAVVVMKKQVSDIKKNIQKIIDLS